MVKSRLKKTSQLTTPKISLINHLSIDIETYSDVNLNKAGAYRYSEDPSFEILCFGYSLNEGEVQVVNLQEGGVIPSEILRLINDDSCIKHAYNASFERVCLSRYLGLPKNKFLNPRSWRCTMVAASYLGLPLSLKGVGAVLKLENQKLEEGRDLIKFFCSPVKPTKSNGGATKNLFKNHPEKRDLFLRYNKRDVEVELAIQQRLKNHPLPDWLWEEYAIDQEINDRGVYLDTALAEKAIKIDGVIHEELSKLMVDITELDNPNSVAQLKQWLFKYGVEPEDLGKKTVTSLEKQFADSEIGLAMALRKMLAKTSIKKYERMKEAVCSDGRIRGMFQFYGANRTGRFSSHIVQLHNLPQNKLPDLAVVRDLVLKEDVEALKMLYEDVPDILSQLLRTAFIPEGDGQFLVSDYSAIEARVLAWYAGETWRIEAFKNNEDIYCSSASKMFGVPVVKNGINGDLRKKGKIAELALGYGGSTGALVAMGALDEGSGLTEEELVPLVKSWRNANKNITKFWWEVGDAVRYVIEEGTKTKCSCEKKLGNLIFTYKSSMLFITLPSGRRLSYVKPKIIVNEYGNESISYEGIGEQKKWTRIESYGPKFVENIIQGTARDILCFAMRTLKDSRIVMHVHDELIIEDFTGKSPEFVEKSMAKLPDWASGLILNAEGYSCKFYLKE